MSSILLDIARHCSGADSDAQNTTDLPFKLASSAILLIKAFVEAEGMVVFTIKVTRLAGFPCFLSPLLLIIR
jgi:hypothetical protein